MRGLLFAVPLLAACQPAAPTPCAGPALTKGPWVMRATSTSASIFFETSEPGCVEVGLSKLVLGMEQPEQIVAGSARETTVASHFGAEAGVAMPDLAGTYWVNQVDLTGLEPGACYHYRVPAADAGDGAPSTGRLCTPPPMGTPFRFLAIGDTNPRLGHTAPVLAHALVDNPAFTVHVGDLQYYSSTETWAYWFRAMRPLLRVGALFPAVGNHENELDGAEYVDYFDRLFHQPSLDGTPMWYRFEWSGVWFFTIDTEEPYDSGSPQYRWLSDALADAASRADFRFSVVFMHRNLYTLGDAAPQVDQRRALAPLFDAHKVRLVLSGHMHGYERFEVGNVTYVTTAGGGGVIDDVNKNVANYPDDVVYRSTAAAAYHALLVDVYGPSTTLHGRAVDETGAVIDEFTHTYD